MRGFQIGELLEAFEHERTNLSADDQIESRQCLGGQRCKTPPVHFDQPIVRPVWIGGESGQNHSSLAVISSSGVAPPPSPALGDFTPRCSLTRPSTSADISG